LHARYLYKRMGPSGEPALVEGLLNNPITQYGPDSASRLPTVHERILARPCIHAIGGFPNKDY